MMKRVLVGVGLLVAALSVSAAQESSQIADDTLRTALIEYRELAAEFKKKFPSEEAVESSDRGDRQPIDRAQRLKLGKELLAKEDRLLALAGAAEPAAKAFVLATVTDTRLELRHRSAVPTAELVIASGHWSAAKIALDTGQFSQALRLAGSGDVDLKNKISRLERYAAATEPDVKCPDAQSGDLCRSLAWLYGWLEYARTSDSVIEHVTNAALKDRSDPRFVKSSALLAALDDRDEVRRLLGLSSAPQEIRWKKMRVSSATAQKLVALARADRTASEGAVKVLESLWDDASIRATLLGSAIFGESLTDTTNPPARFQGTPITAPKVGADERTEDDVTVSLHDVIAVGKRRYVVINAAIGAGIDQKQRWSFFELPASGGTEVWHWAASALANGELDIDRGDIGDGVLLSDAEGSGGFLDAWIVMPPERRTIKIAANLYQGDIKRADVDGDGRKELVLSRKLQNSAECNACPGKREATVLRFKGGKLVPVGRYVSSRGQDIRIDDIKRRLAILHKPVPKTTLDKAVAGLKAGTIFRPEQVREKIAVILLAIDKFVQARNFPDAVRYAENLVSIASDPPAFDERSDWLAAAAGLGADAARAMGKDSRASALTSAFPSTDRQTREDALRSARFRVAQARGDTAEQCKVLQEARDQNPSESAASPLLTQYFLSAGDSVRALESARATVQDKWLKGQDNTEAFFAEAAALTERERLDNALAALTLIVRHDSNQIARALLGAAAIAVRAGELRLAQDLLDNSLKALLAETERDADWSSSEATLALLLYGDILRQTGGQDTAEKLTRAAFGHAASGAADSTPPLHCH